MDKYDKHLDFLIEVTGLEASYCTEVFKLKCKRDIRKALLYLLGSGVDKGLVLNKLEVEKSVTAQLQLVEAFFQAYAPNPPFKRIARAASKRQTTIRLDTETAEKLLKFRRAPTKAEIERLLIACAQYEPKVRARMLKGLRSFGRELKPFEEWVRLAARDQSIEVATQAYHLLAEIPGGVLSALGILMQACKDEHRRFHALSALQKAQNIPAAILKASFAPLIQEYRRLAMQAGTHNALWEELQLIKAILRNNGVPLAIPNLDIERK